MKLALIHDWLIHMRGGEKVLEALAELYPDATIYTLFYDRKGLSPSLQRMRIIPSFLQHFPGIKFYYRWLLPFLPWIIRTVTVEDDTDIVISCSHCVAKGIRIPKNSYHVCYCFTPMRYLWEFEEVYFKKTPPVIKSLLRFILSKLRSYDLKSNDSVHHFVGISDYIRQRIKRCYGRDAGVIYPPADLEFYYPDGVLSDYYLAVSAFVPYKRIDLVIEAFNKLDRKLLIVGSGPLAGEYAKLRKNNRIFFLGAVSSAELRRLYSRARAVIFPAEEDFGIVPVEAQACGTPVIAYAKGGSLETVQAGCFFDGQTAEAIRLAVLDFEQLNLDRNVIPGRVKFFSKDRFKDEIRTLIDSILTRTPSYALS